MGAVITAEEAATKAIKVRQQRASEGLSLGCMLVSPRQALI
jgi:hypothetical protein